MIQTGLFTAVIASVMKKVMRGTGFGASIIIGVIGRGVRNGCRFASPMIIVINIIPRQVVALRMIMIGVPFADIDDRVADMDVIIVVRGVVNCRREDGPIAVDEDRRCSQSCRTEEEAHAGP